MGLAPGVNLAPTRGILYEVGVRDLREVSVSGAAEADIPDLVTEGLTVGASGAGAVYAAGAVDWQHVTASGAGCHSGLGVVEYCGRPYVDLRVSGGGVVRGDGCGFR